MSQYRRLNNILTLATVAIISTCCCFQCTKNPPPPMHHRALIRWSSILWGSLVTWAHFLWGGFCSMWLTGGSPVDHSMIRLPDPRYVSCQCGRHGFNVLFFASNCMLLKVLTAQWEPVILSILLEHFFIHIPCDMLVTPVSRAAANVTSYFWTSQCHE